MFKLLPNDAPVKWPVTVTIPQDGGRTTKHTFDVWFRVLTQSELDEHGQSGDQLFFATIVTGWDRVGDIEGNALDFTPAALQQLVEIPYVREAIRFAYFECISGRAAKN